MCIGVLGLHVPKFEEGGDFSNEKFSDFTTSAFHTLKTGHNFNFGGTDVINWENDDKKREEIN